METETAPLVEKLYAPLRTSVLEVTMRDGNNICKLMVLISHRMVLEVTMRDGNFFNSFKISSEIIVLEVTMRDGNSRGFINVIKSYRHFRFRSDYEGWKPIPF